MFFVTQKKYYQDQIRQLLNISIVFACFALWLPTAIVSISTSIILILWLLSDFKFKCLTVLKQPGSIAALFLFAAYLFGSFYSTATFPTSLKIVLKYSKLLLIPIIASSITDNHTRKYAIKAFILGAYTTLFISYFKWFRLLPQDMLLHDIFYEGHVKNSFYAFKNSIAHGILMSFAFYIFLSKSFLLNKKINIKWLFLAFITFFNIMYLGFARTGQIVSVILLSYVMHKKFGKRFVFLILLIASSGLLLKSQISPYLPQRLINIDREILEHNPSEHLTSAGERLEMYTNAIEIIKKSPYFGYGTGSVAEEYKKNVGEKNTLLKNVTNLHNQFLMTFLEIGFFGFIALIYMLYTHWSILNKEYNKYYEYRIYVKGLVLTIICGSFFNSLLLDAGEGKFYCILAGVLLSAYKINKS